MNAKRILTLVLCLAVSLGCLLMLAACGGGEVECEHTSVGTDGKCTECGEQVKEPEVQLGDGDVVLVKDGAACFKIVAGSSTSKIMQDIDALVADLNELLTGDTERVADSKDTVSDVEILIGSVNTRGDEYKVDEHYLGHKGYEVKLVGNKIAVYAGDVTQYEKAIKWLKSDVFGISKKTESLDNVIVNAEKVNKQVLTEYDIDSVKIAGNDLDDYVIAIDKKLDGLTDAATTAQDAFYRNFGAWCEIVSVSKADDYDKIIQVNLVESTGEENGFTAYVTDGGKLMIDCEFSNRIAEVTTATLIDGIASVRRNTDLSVGEYLTYDVRNIYYADFGAKGDGVNDDFNAIKACHEYANLYGHTVNSDGASKTYYIGQENGYESISVMTDTYWHGCGFIFDDTGILPGEPESMTPIFSICPSESSVSYKASDSPITSLDMFTENVGWAPGYPAMLYVMNSNVKHYLRYGQNADDGFSQQEVILVDAEGNVDPSTPVQWHYEEITSLTVYRIDDDPIVVSGGTADNKARVETKFNCGPSRYYYYSRNFYITRSNVTIENIEHTITGQIPQKDENGNIWGSGSPYEGFTTVMHCNNVTIQGFLFQCPETYYVVENGNITTNNMGTYEMNASLACNLTYRDCTQSNFFEPDGSVVFKGLMGTNYCRNLVFDNMFVTSFDAHKGVYNATLKNSTCEHLNFIGKGTVRIEDVTVYIDGRLHSAFNLRSDYGSTWEGDFIIDGLTLKYYEYYTGAVYQASLFNVGWQNHFFGYTTYLPKNIVINDLKTVSYDFGLDEKGNRWEQELKVNDKTISIFSSTINDGGYFDSTVLNATDSTCPHEEVDDTGKLCAGCSGTWNLNPYMPTEVITITNEDTENPVKIKWMTSPHFEDTVITVDGKKVTLNLQQS